MSEFNIRKYALVHGFAAECESMWGRIQPVDATPFASNLTRWNGMHMEGDARTWFTRKQKAERWER
jgi:hypothetical protein